MDDLDEDTRLKLIGLRTVAQDHWKQIQSLELAAARLVSEPIDMSPGHASDYLAGESDSCNTPERLWAATAEFRKKKGRT